MNREKQIEEMVIALTESQHEYDKAWHECLQNRGKRPDRENVFYAKFLLDKGYRKASDVAREIFEEIEKYLVTGCTFYGQAIHSIGVGTFAELKKKYTEEER